MIRQGDVLLKKVDKIEGKKINEKTLILAEGEVTGHFHEMSGDATFYDNNGQILIEVGKGGAQITHQEHDLAFVPEGKYVKVLQREYDIVEGVRQVMD